MDSSLPFCSFAWHAFTTAMGDDDDDDDDEEGTGIGGKGDVGGEDGRRQNK